MPHFVRHTITNDGCLAILIGEAGDTDVNNYRIWLDPESTDKSGCPCSSN